MLQRGQTIPANTWERKSLPNRRSPTAQQWQSYSVHRLGTCTFLARRVSTSYADYTPLLLAKRDQVHYRGYWIHRLALSQLIHRNRMLYHSPLLYGHLVPSLRTVTEVGVWGHGGVEEGNKVKALRIDYVELWMALQPMLRYLGPTLQKQKNVIPGRATQLAKFTSSLCHS